MLNSQVQLCPLRRNVCCEKKVTDFFVAKLEISWGPLCFFCVCLFLFERGGYCLSSLVLYSSIFRNWCVCVCVLGCCVLFGLKSLSLFVVLFFVVRYVLFCKNNLPHKEIVASRSPSNYSRNPPCKRCKKVQQKKCQRSLRFSLYMYPNIYTYTLGYA